MIILRRHTLVEKNVFRTGTAGRGRNYVVIPCFSYWKMISDDEPFTRYYCTDLGAVKEIFHLRVPTLNTF